MHATIHRSFNLNSVAVVNHSDRIRIRYITKQGVQIAGMIFQTRSGVARHTFFPSAPSTSRIQLDWYRYLQNDVRAYSYPVEFLCNRQFNSFSKQQKRSLSCFFHRQGSFLIIFSATTLQHPLKSLSFLFQHYL